MSKLFKKIQKSFDFNQLKLFLFKDFILRLINKIHSSVIPQILNGNTDEHFEWCITEVINEFKLTQIFFNKKLSKKLINNLSKDFYINSVKDKKYCEKWISIFEMQTENIENLNLLYNIYHILDENLIQKLYKY